MYIYNIINLPDKKASRSRSKLKILKLLILSIIALYAKTL